MFRNLASLYYYSSGADIAAKKTSGDTPLHLAACRGHEAVCRVLLDHGASTQSKNQQDRTPTMEAEIQTHYHIVRLLRRYDDPGTLMPS